ncbi:MAG TPA: DMT family transporter [Acidimicrobiales bacterium]|nr:DMT family transporter [Acidimicrobiales bacterium]
MSERRAQFGVVGAALLFGSTFVVMRDSVKAAAPTAFLCARFGIGAIALLLLARRRGPMPKGTLVPSVITASALLTGYVLQTVGLQYTKTSTSAFITYLLVVLVPVFAAIQHREMPPFIVVIAVGVTTCGLWLLTGGVDAIGKGELLTLGCAAAYALHILLIERWTARVDVLWFMGIQLGVVSLGCFVPGLVQGGYGFGWHAWWGAFYTGIGASAVALTLQAWGQAVLPPTRTALLLMLEPVSAAFIGYAVGERIGAHGVLGAVLILVGVTVAEVGDARKLNEYKAEWPSNDPIQGGTT